MQATEVERMIVDPTDFYEIPGNHYGISAGCLLFPTASPLVAGGGTSLDFVLEQGGDEDTFVFVFGIRSVRDLLGRRVEILEGVFLSPLGPGFRPTWAVQQLLRETDLGGWRVVPTEEVVAQWTAKVERRMNTALA